MPFMLVLDLKTDSGICEPSRILSQGRSAHVFRPACVHPGHGLHAVENLSALRGEFYQDFPKRKAFILFSISREEFCRLRAGRAGTPPILFPLISGCCFHIPRAGGNSLASHGFSFFGTAHRRWPYGKQKKRCDFPRVKFRP